MGAFSSREDAAVTRLRDAEALAVRVRSEADARRADADALAVRVRSEADARHADADARHADASAAAVSARRGAEAAAARVRTAVLAAAAAALAALALDVYLHESPAHIRRRMLRTLRAARPPPAQASLLRPAQAPLLPPATFRPVMLLGPTGCGKSTLLASVARAALAAPAAAPALLIRMRLPQGSLPRGMGVSAAAAGGAAAAPAAVAPAAAAAAAAAGAAAAAAAGASMLDLAGAQLFAQIGFPSRRSLLGGLLQRVTAQGLTTQAELTARPSNRIIAALRLLFEAAAELQREREAAGASRLDAAPLLLFDEVLDLIKDARLARAGGREVFDVLGALIVGYGVDRRAVRVIAAGSSAELNDAFAESTPANESRWLYYELGDPAPADLAAALAARGYSAAEAAAMLALCGARLRLFDGALGGPPRQEAADFLHEARASAATAFERFFGSLDVAEDRAALARALDALEAEASPAPRKAGLPAGLRRVDLAPLIYLQRSGDLAFQSQLLRSVWPTVRARYTASPPQGRAESSR